MVGPTRSKLREAAAQPLHRSCSVQPRRRRRRITGAAGPEMEDEPPEEVDTPELPLPVDGGHLPGGARPYSPPRTRNRNAQNCLQMEMVTKTRFLRRFHFFTCLLAPLLDKVHLLRRRQFSSRATICTGEQKGPGRALGRGPQRLPAGCPHTGPCPLNLGFELVWGRLEGQCNTQASRQ